MTEQRDFVATVKEPVGGFAVELEFHENIAGLTADTVTIFLRDGSTLDDAKRVADTLNSHGSKVATSG